MVVEQSLFAGFNSSVFTPPVLDQGAPVAAQRAYDFAPVIMGALAQAAALAADRDYQDVFSNVAALPVEFAFLLDSPHGWGVLCACIGLGVAFSPTVH